MIFDMNTNLSLQVAELTRVFSGKRTFTAVSKVSFNIGEGEIVGLLGPNGAGKSTTIQMLLGVLKPTSGEVFYFGLPFEKNRKEILGQVAYVSGYSRMPWNLTVRENLDIHARLMGIPAKTRKDRIEELLERFEVSHLTDQLFSKLSAGETTRAILAKAFLPRPKVALLDEPTAALDPDIAQIVRQFVLEQARSERVAILYTSHNMVEVAELCDRVIFLRDGKVLAIDSPEKLAKTAASSRLRLLGVEHYQRLVSLMDQHGLTACVEPDYVEIGVDDKHISDLLTTIVSHGIRFRQLEVNHPTLEEYFLKVSGGET